MPPVVVLEVLIEVLGEMSTDELGHVIILSNRPRSMETHLEVGVVGDGLSVVLDALALTGPRADEPVAVGQGVAIIVDARAGRKIGQRPGEVAAVVWLELNKIGV
ncbi:hypothetical protein [Actinomyces israelii]|uniref:hypothetical protein n=1 Tax=Actinomyces israelii TaxID=1659 RepID=UPI002555C7EA|nr:hypothetical protein [Actinomyces israelii]